MCVCVCATDPLINNIISQAMFCDFRPLPVSLNHLVQGFQWPNKLTKNAAQGAAASVWAAISNKCDGGGGEYLEDCSSGKPREDGKLSAGYAPHAYDEEAAKKLWDVSSLLVWRSSCQHKHCILQYIGKRHGKLRH